jgi:hypothetical protein
MWPSGETRASTTSYGIGVIFFLKIEKCLFHCINKGMIAGADCIRDFSG